MTVKEHLDASKAAHRAAQLFQRNGDVAGERGSWALALEQRQAANHADPTHQDPAWHDAVWQEDSHHDQHDALIDFYELELGIKQHPVCE